MKIARLKNLIASDSGATMIEFGLMAAFVAISTIGGLMISGESLAAIFESISDNMAMAAASRR